MIPALAYQWLDAVWIPVAALMVHQGQKIKAVVFVLGCMVAMRLQVELIQSTGFTKGVLGLIDMPLFQRGLLVYSLFIVLFIALSYFSPGTRGVIYLAASISLFFMAFFVGSVVMLL